MQHCIQAIKSEESPRSERYQLDYIMIRSGCRNTVGNCHSYPGTDVNSDHNLVAANLKQVRYNKIIWCNEEAENAVNSAT